MLTVLCRVHAWSLHSGQFCREDDRHDDAIDCHNLAENDGYQILSSYSRCLDATTDDRRAGYEDTPFNIT